MRVFTRQVGELLDAERASLFLVDRDRQQLVLRVAQDMPDGDDVRIPLGSGIAGAAAPDAARSCASTTPTPTRASTRRSTPRPGFRTRSILCLPLQDRSGEVFAVAQLLNRRDGRPFDDDDERRYAGVRSLAVRAARIAGQLGGQRRRRA